MSYINLIKHANLHLLSHSMGCLRHYTEILTYSALGPLADAFTTLPDHRGHKVGEVEIAQTGLPEL